MNKVKFLSILVSLLVALNIIILSFFMIDKEHLKHQNGNKGDRIYQKFRFTDQQIEDFESSKTVHKEESERLKKYLSKRV